MDKPSDTIIAQIEGTLRRTVPAGAAMQVDFQPIISARALRSTPVASGPPRRSGPARRAFLLGAMAGIGLVLLVLGREG